MTYLSDETIKQIYFYCDNNDPKAVIADEVDIVQFANKLLAYAHPHLAKAEHERCVQIVQGMNKEVAAALATQGPT